MPLPRGKAPEVVAGGGLTGHWRYNRAGARGIALSYEPTPPRTTHSPVVRVLCYCGEQFTLEDDSGVCPGCGQPAAWPTMSPVEREMRADLEALLRAHDR